MMMIRCSGGLREGCAHWRETFAAFWWERQDLWDYLLGTKASK